MHFYWEDIKEIHWEMKDKWLTKIGVLISHIWQLSVCLLKHVFCLIILIVSISVNCMKHVIFSWKSLGWYKFRESFCLCYLCMHLLQLLGWTLKCYNYLNTHKIKQYLKSLFALLPWFCCLWQGFHSLVLIKDFFTFFLHLICLRFYFQIRLPNVIEATINRLTSNLPFIFFKNLLTFIFKSWQISIHFNVINNFILNLKIGS